MKLQIVSTSLVATLSSWLWNTSSAMPALTEPFTVELPDGKKITLSGRGGELDHWLVDSNGYTVVRRDGQYVYESPSDYQDIFVSDTVGDFDPSLAGAAPGVRKEKTPEECFKTLCGGIPDEPIIEDDCEGHKCGNKDGLRRRAKVIDPGATEHDRRRRLTPSTGTIKNLVLLLEFNDNTNDLPTESEIETLMNSETNDPDICPTGSLKSVYNEMSFGQLNIESTISPWIKLSQNEPYYGDGKSISTNLHEGIREALYYLDKNDIIDFPEFDSDGDGYIDSITILHSSYAAENMQTDCRGVGYENRVWSHKWKVWSDSSGSYVGPWISKKGVLVWDYHISAALWGSCGSEIGRIGAIAHETGHFLGMKDLYDIDGGGRGVGGWCMMGSAWGFDNEQLYPGHLSAYWKVYLGWIEPKSPVIGRNLIAHTEEESTNVPQIYKIGDGEYGFPEGEYLLLENRRKIGLDSILPDEGLAIYHIDEKADFSSEGFPGQSGASWPANGKHYKIALLQADGRFDLEKGQNKGGDADLFRSDNLSILSPSHDQPEAGPFPNTDSYQDGNLQKTGVSIYLISEPNDVMTFYFAPETVYSDR